MNVLCASRLRARLNNRDSLISVSEPWAHSRSQRAHGQHFSPRGRRVSWRGKRVVPRPTVSKAVESWFVQSWLQFCGQCRRSNSRPRPSVPLTTILRTIGTIGTLLKSPETPCLKWEGVLPRAPISALTSDASNESPPCWAVRGDCSLPCPLARAARNLGGFSIAFPATNAKAAPSLGRLFSTYRWPRALDAALMKRLHLAADETPISLSSSSLIRDAISHHLPVTSFADQVSIGSQTGRRKLLFSASVPTALEIQPRVRKRFRR